MSIKPLPSVHKYAHTHTHTNKITTTKSNQKKKKRIFFSNPYTIAIYRLNSVKYSDIYEMCLQNGKEANTEHTQCTQQRMASFETCIS